MAKKPAPKPLTKGEVRLLAVLLQVGKRMFDEWAVCYDYEEAQERFKTMVQIDRLIGILRREPFWWDDLTNKPREMNNGR